MPAPRLLMRHLRDLRRLRLANGLSQAAIARSLGLGVGAIQCSRCDQPYQLSRSRGVRRCYACPPGHKPRAILRETDFTDEANLAARREHGITGYVAPGLEHHGEADAPGRRRPIKMPLINAAATRLKRTRGRTRYRPGKPVVKSVDRPKRLRLATTPPG